jgi:lysophospholipid acyltransferase (LPLAT)-like uncharacterized protein
MKLVRWLAAWIAALCLLAWRLTCRCRFVNDPRPELRARGRPYAYALLHAHQVAAVLANDELKMAAMLSRSADGDLLAPSLRLRRILAVRGSTRTRKAGKGGLEALNELTRLAAARVPVLLAVDGPRGPRNRVHRGIADLAKKSGAVILPVVVLPTRRWILSRTWDRFQIPKPFCTVRVIFGPPLEGGSDEEARGLSLRLKEALDALEARLDPLEHEQAQARAARIERAS